MAGTVTLDVDSFQHSDTPFDAVVIVTGAPAGANVTATLSQTRGKPPLLTPLSSKASAPSGTVTFTFAGVKLAGPTLAVLLAGASDDKGTPYTPDAERVQVL
jgi:hypothetical protein